MFSIVLRTQSNSSNPFIDQSRVLSSAQVPFLVDPTRKRVVIDTATAAFEPRKQACPRVSGNLKLDGPASILLDHH